MKELLIFWVRIQRWRQS